MSWQNAASFHTYRAQSRVSRLRVLGLGHAAAQHPWREARAGTAVVGKTGQAALCSGAVIAGSYKSCLGVFVFCGESLCPDSRGSWCGTRFVGVSLGGKSLFSLFMRSRPRLPWGFGSSASPCACSCMLLLLLHAMGKHCPCCSRILVEQPVLYSVIRRSSYGAPLIRF